MPKWSDTTHSSSRIKSASSSSPAASSAPKLGPTRRRHHRASTSTVRTSCFPRSPKLRQSSTSCSKKSAATSSPRTLKATSFPSASGASSAHHRPSALPSGGSLSSIHLQNTSLSTASTASAPSPAPTSPRARPDSSAKLTCRPAPSNSAAVRASEPVTLRPSAATCLASSGSSTWPSQTFGAYFSRMSANSMTSKSFLSYHWCIGPTIFVSKRQRPNFVRACKIFATTSHRISRPSNTCPCPMFRIKRIRRFFRSFFGCQGICTRGFTSCAHSTNSSPLQWSYSRTSRPSDSTRFTVAGNTRHPYSSTPNRSRPSTEGSSFLRSGLPTSLPGPRREFTRSSLRYSSGPSISIRTAKRAISCGNEIVFFLNLSSPVFRTVT